MAAGTEPSDLHARLRSGNEAVFTALVKRLQPTMLAVAFSFVANRATAEEVVQDTWLAVIESLDRFEGRSSLKNWIFVILANKARTRAVRDRRTITVANLAEQEDDGAPAVDPSLFDRSGAWIDLPRLWDELTPERIVAGRQLWSHVAEAVAGLPPAQRAVLMLRRIERLAPTEVRSILGVSDANQRVLLHRARSRIREHLDRLAGP